MSELLPRPDLPLMRVRDALRDLTYSAGNVGSTPGNFLVRRDAYLAWVSAAESQLRNLFSAPDMWQALHTERYWQIAAIDRETPRAMERIADETTWQVARLQAIHDDLKGDKETLGLPSDEYAAVVPDTNVFLHYAPYDDIPWPKLTGSKRVRLVVPLIVIDQLDDLSFRSKTDMYRTGQERHQIAPAAAG